MISDHSKYFIVKFREAMQDGDLSVLPKLSYMANQIVGKGGCGNFDRAEHSDYEQVIKERGPSDSAEATVLSTRFIGRYKQLENK